MTPTPPSASAEKAIREALPVVAWTYTHKVSGAVSASDWRWPVDHAARESHDETSLVRFVDAEAHLAELRAEVERLKAIISGAGGL